MKAQELAAVASIISKNPVFEGPDATLVLAAYNCLANGEPLSIDSLSTALARSIEDVASTPFSAASEFRSKAAVSRLVTVVLAGLQPDG